MTTLIKRHIPSGESAQGRFCVDVSPDDIGWDFSGLKILSLEAGAFETWDMGDCEGLILPLEGSCVVVAGQEEFILQGRAGVFEGVTDFVHLSPGSVVSIQSEDGGRFAIPLAKSTAQFKPRHYGREHVRTQVKTVGGAVHEIHTYTFRCGRRQSHLQAYEVIAPSGERCPQPVVQPTGHNRLARELEEIYYFEMNGSAETGTGFHRTYADSDRPVDQIVAVQSGDVTIAPNGWHGPCIAPMVADMYCLNVMAGEIGDERRRRIEESRLRHAIDTWESQQFPPHLRFNK